jgi:co-chaperonin GroES (HSP10)
MIKAVFNNIVVKNDDLGDKMYGSIVVPDMGKEMPHIGTIIDVGPGRLNDGGKFKLHFEYITKDGERNNLKLLKR